MMAGRGSPAAVGGPARHIPVMLSEVVAALDPKDGDVVVDGTFGAGGYSEAILSSADCKVVAIDRDPDALRLSGELADKYPGRLLAVLGRFSEMETIAASEGFTSVDGVVLDLGVSSMQLDRPERGFSFMQDGPLDMRMGAGGPTASDIVNTLSEAALADIIGKLGEERRARAIAKAIVGAALRAADHDDRRARQSRSQGSRPQTRRDQAPRDPDLPGAPALSQRGADRARTRPCRRRASLGRQGAARHRHFPLARGPDRQTVPRQPQRAAAARLAPPPRSRPRNSCAKLPAS